MIAALRPRGCRHRGPHRRENLRPLSSRHPRPVVAPHRPLTRAAHRAVSCHPPHVGTRARLDHRPLAHALRIFPAPSGLPLLIVELITTSLAIRNPDVPLHGDLLSPHHGLRAPGEHPHFSFDRNPSASCARDASACCHPAQTRCNSRSGGRAAAPRRQWTSFTPSGADAPPGTSAFAARTH